MISPFTHVHNCVIGTTLMPQESGERELERIYLARSQDLNTKLHLACPGHNSCCAIFYRPSGPPVSVLSQFDRSDF